MPHDVYVHFLLHEEVSGASFDAMLWMEQLILWDETLNTLP